MVLLPVLALTLGSCAKIKEALVVKQDVNFTIDMPVSVSQPLKSNLFEIDERVEFDPTTNADVASLAQKIQGVEMNSVTITVSEISDAPVTLTDCRLVFYEKLDNNELKGMEIVMDGTYRNGDTKTIEGIDFEWLEAMLLSMNPFILILYGNTDKSPVSFTLSAVLDTEVSVRILGEE